MKLISTTLSLCIFTVSVATAAVPLESKQIDRLIEADYKKHKITPNPPASDEVFMRRIYLDILGRIPTKTEADTFLDAEASDKRSKLIDYLLDSEGSVSHDFNYWADILRIKSRMQGEAGGAYSQWVKEALKENKPYDEFVKSMITAEGYIWDNGAVGYYLRDAGMPLDNMSNTTQVFLGTQLVCAQCHNHPFDKWQQKDYYSMAAYTYGVQTRVNPEKELGLTKAIDKSKKRSARNQIKLTGSARRALNDILQPLSYGATEQKRQIKLPNDYQYDDAAPGSVVAPATLDLSIARSGGGFSIKKNDSSTRRSKIGKSGSPRDGYADWLTATTNPRFTKVIANRLWKRAMGMGLIEPVDDFRDDTKPSNPELMDYLEKQMRGKSYDMKRFMRIVYNTRTYQRAATTEEVPADQPYYFQGPLLRRMTAEQMWDSIVTLTIPEPDMRKGDSNYQKRSYDAKARADRLRERADKDPRDIIEQAQKIGAAMDNYEAEAKKIRFEILVAQEDDNQKLVRELRGKEKAAAKARNETIKQVNADADRFGMSSMMGSNMMMEDKKKKKKSTNTNDKWKVYNRGLVRASELPSPAPNGHFLREFGQSDRETIQNSNQDTSVAQALGLLNGTITDNVLDTKSVVMQHAANGMSAEEKRDALFLTILGRAPTSKEITTFDNYIAKAGDGAYKNIIWALLNTPEFAFIQ